MGWKDTARVGGGAAGGAVCRAAGRVEARSVKRGSWVNKISMSVQSESCSCAFGPGLVGPSDPCKSAQLHTGPALFWHLALSRLLGGCYE